MKKWIAGVAVVVIIIFGILSLSGNNSIISPKIASVNGESISQSEYDNRISQLEKFYASQNQTDIDKNTLKQDVINELVDSVIIEQYAKQHKIIASDSEIVGRYGGMVDSFNKRQNISGTSDSEFLAKINELYGIDKSEYLKTVRLDLLKEKVQAVIGKPLTDWLTEQRNSGQVKIY